MKSFSNFSISQLSCFYSEMSFLFALESACKRVSAKKSATISEIAILYLLMYQRGIQSGNISQKKRPSPKAKRSHTKEYLPLSLSAMVRSNSLFLMHSHHFLHFYFIKCSYVAQFNFRFDSIDHWFCQLFPFFPLIRRCGERILIEHYLP